MLSLVLLLACILSQFDVSSEGPVIELSVANFNQEIAKHELILVEFFAPWCEHCKQLAPLYLEAAEKLETSTPTLPLANVDCTGQTENLCITQGIRGFPTLKLFRKGEFAEDYKGPRNADGIVSYMMDQAAPSSMYISSEEKLQEFTDHPEPRVVGFFKLESDSLIRNSFVECSEKLRGKFRFAHTYESISGMGLETTLPEIVEGDQVWLFQSSRLRTKLEAPVLRIPESDSKDMQKFIEDNFMGLVGIRDQANLEHYDKVTRSPRFIFYIKIDWDSNRQTFMYWRNRLLKLAKEYESKMFFAMSDNTIFAGELIHKFGINQTEKMQGVIVNKGKKYVMAQESGVEMSIDLVSKFIEDFFEGKASRFLKSAPAPVEDNGPVKEVVGSTFEEVVLDNDKDVMIEFYAPWCGHCKSLAPKYDELGAKLENNSNIVIAKMDVMANDFPDIFTVEGIPTLYWVPANKKDSPVPYEGRREVADLFSYIEKQATIPFNSSDKNGKEEL